MKKIAVPRRSTPRSIPAALLAARLAALLGCAACSGPEAAREPAVSHAPAAPVEVVTAGPKLPEITELEGNQLVLPGQVAFETGSEVLLPENDALLAMVERYLAAKPAITLLRIEGHTDGGADPAADQQLSEARAVSVARALVQRGVDCRRLLPVGFGATKPLAPNDTPANRAANRRIAFVTAALRDRPIGGLPVDGGGRIAGDPCH